jgi:hypothetical protein
MWGHLKSSGEDNQLRTVIDIHIWRPTWGLHQQINKEDSHRRVWLYYWHYHQIKHRINNTMVILASNFYELFHVSEIFSALCMSTQKIFPWINPSHVGIEDFNLGVMVLHFINKCNAWCTELCTWPITIVQHNHWRWDNMNRCRNLCTGLQRHTCDVQSSYS